MDHVFSALGISMFFVILGSIFSQGKGSFLIAGYNMLSEEEKENYDEKALCRFMGIICYALAIQSFLITVSFVYSIIWLQVLSIIYCLGTIIGAVFYINKKE